MQSNEWLSHSWGFLSYFWRCYHGSMGRPLCLQGPMSPLSPPFLHFEMEPSPDHQGLRASSLIPGEVQLLCCFSLSSFHPTKLMFILALSMAWDPTCSQDGQSVHRKTLSLHPVLILTTWLSFPGYVLEPCGELGRAEVMAEWAPFWGPQLWKCISTCSVVCSSRVF